MKILVLINSLLSCLCIYLKLWIYEGLHWAVAKERGTTANLFFYVDRIALISIVLSLIAVGLSVFIVKNKLCGKWLARMNAVLAFISFLICFFIVA
jgi:hypothetical protein